MKWNDFRKAQCGAEGNFLDRLVQLDERLAAISGDRSYLCYSPTPKNLDDAGHNGRALAVRLL
jgi:hypothetical protein